MENLLPPGALGPASVSIGGPMPPPTITSLPAGGPAPLSLASRAPMIRSDRPRVAVHKLSPEEKAVRRLRKNAIVFGLSIVVLIVVFYLLAR